MKLADFFDEPMTEGQRKSLTLPSDTAKMILLINTSPLPAEWSVRDLRAAIPNLDPELTKGCFAATLCALSTHTVNVIADTGKRVPDGNRNPRRLYTIPDKQRLAQLARTIAKTARKEAA